MTARVIVSARFVWSDYPGLRPGRLYAGKPDLTRHPVGETHLAAGPDAVDTLCGRERTPFPHQFPEGTAYGKRSTRCPECEPTAG